MKRRLTTNAPDYWDHATNLELSVLAGDQQASEDALGDALAAVREKWEPETTARNLRLIREAREKRGIDVGWIADFEAELKGGVEGKGNVESISSLMTCEDLC